ncbi:MAG: COX15/CtaA family protein [Pseudomonadota bacterium]
MATRKLFEEVGAGDVRPAAPAPGVIDRARGGARGAIRVWLVLLGLLVVAMIVVGGLTRLTDSGLSITEWRPLTGAIPPLSAADWQAEFDRYRQIDEWALQNSWMSLGDFKVIYWWEWGHRQLGRVIGLVWAAGFLWFALRGALPAGRQGLLIPALGFAGFAAVVGAEVARVSGMLSLDVTRQIESVLLIAMAAIAAWGLMAQARMDWTARLLYLGFLGGLQGTIGWWMVSSGVTTGEETLDVASYRLATHLGLAFVIIGLITWYALLLARAPEALLGARRAREDRLFRISTGLLHFTFLQILIGALVAGIDAGRSYTDWPLMGGQVLPPFAFDLEPLWRNFFENAGLVQFIHRNTGYLLLAFGIVVWLRGRRSAYPATRSAFHVAFGLLLAQIVLGIVTVIYAAPWNIAIFHQLLGVILWIAILRARFLAGYPTGTTLRQGAAA